METWRQIGDFLGKDERTVKRWEATRALPVHRLPGGGNAAVFAYPDELERWLAAGRAAVEAQPPSVGVSQPEAPVPSPPASRSFPGLAHAVWAGLGVVVLAVVGAAAAFHIPASSHPAHVPKAAAVELYRRGRSEWSRRTPGCLKAALADFTQAAMQDPDYADAYVGLADTYNLLREYAGMPDEEAYPRAEWAARRAVALDERNAAAHAALAFVEFHWEWDAKGTRRDFERAIALDPSNSTAHHWYATALVDIPDFPTAIREIERAEALAPESAAIRADKGAILATGGRRDEAEALLLRMEGADPSFLSPHIYLGTLYRREGRYGDYLREIAEVARLRGDEDSRKIAEALKSGFDLGGAAGLKKADAAVKEALYRSGRINARQLAFAYAEDDEPERALPLLATAMAHHDADMLKLSATPEWAPLKARPQFAALLAQLR